jgi:hypothetical protein
MGLSENMAPLSVCRNWLFRTAALAAQALERTCRVNALLGNDGDFIRQSGGYWMVFRTSSTPDRFRHSNHSIWPMKNDGILKYPSLPGNVPNDKVLQGLETKAIEILPSEQIPPPRNTCNSGRFSLRPVSPQLFTNVYLFSFIISLFCCSFTFSHPLCMLVLPFVWGFPVPSPSCQECYVPNDACQLCHPRSFGLEFRMLGYIDIGCFRLMNETIPHSAGVFHIETQCW